MKTKLSERRHLSDYFFDTALPNDEEKCEKCGRKANYLKNGICYDCFFWSS